jgi:phosphopantothenoylcysteine synthetase/decarboxylase
MNTYMWESPFTEQHLGVLRRLGATVVPPVSKKLACGDVGQGAMATPESIAQACWAALAEGSGAQVRHAPADGTAAAAAAAAAAAVADASAGNPAVPMAVTGTSSRG